jgi:hypothetical protein
MMHRRQTIRIRDAPVANPTVDNPMIAAFHTAHHLALQIGQRIGQDRGLVTRNLGFHPFKAIGSRLRKCFIKG